MISNQKKLSKKLELKKSTIVNISQSHMANIKGGYGDDMFGTRALCFSSKASNCTDSSCARTTTVIVCIPL